MRILMLAVCLLSAGVAAEQPSFSAMDVLQLQYASNPVVSPDGSFIVYQRNFMDVMEDERRSNLWRADANSRNARTITTGAVNDGGAAISPDSAQVAYLSANRNDNAEMAPFDSEIYRISLDGGELAALTDRDDPDNGVTVSPNGKQLAWTGFDDKKMSYQLTHLYVMDVDGGNRRVLLADFDASKKYPLLLEIYGGPHTAYGPHFSAAIQLFAAAGYVVYANPRGSIAKRPSQLMAKAIAILEWFERHSTDENNEEAVDNIPVFNPRYG